MVERQNIKRSVIASWHELNPLTARVRFTSPRTLFFRGVFLISDTEGACTRARCGCLSDDARGPRRAALTYLHRSSRARGYARSLVTVATQRLDFGLRSSRVNQENNRCLTSFHQTSHSSQAHTPGDWSLPWQWGNYDKYCNHLENQDIEFGVWTRTYQGPSRPCTFIITSHNSQILLGS